MVPAKSSTTPKKSKKKQTAHTPVLTPDHTHLTFGHHKAIIAALALLHVHVPHLQPHSAYPQSTDAPSDLSEPAERVEGACKSEACTKEMGEGLDAEMNLLLIGLGGGALPMFINKCIPNCHIDVVELDEEMLVVAEKWFGFHRGERLNVHITDGVRFVSECVSAKKHGLYDAIILDVDSKDVSAGVSSPPMEFVEKQFLTGTRMLLKESGLFLTNVAARNKDKRTEMMHLIAGIYPSLISIPIPEDINEVVVGLPSVANRRCLTEVDHKVPMPASAILDLDSTEVKNALEKLATIVSKNAGDRVDIENLIKEWTSLWLCATNFLH